jgi:hypothetical protein
MNGSHSTARVHVRTDAVGFRAVSAGQRPATPEPAVPPTVADQVTPARVKVSPATSASAAPLGPLMLLGVTAIAVGAAMLWRPNDGGGRQDPDGRR